MREYGRESQEAVRSVLPAVRTLISSHQNQTKTRELIKRMRTSESFVLNWILLLITLESAGGLVFYHTNKVKQSGSGNLYSGAKLTNINYLSILKIYTKFGF